MKLPDFKYENEAFNNGFGAIAGLDEVGRGAFAGPVVTGCVVFNRQIYKSANLQIAINDSKKLTSRQREMADKWIRGNCLAYGIGEASVAQINKLGIKKATDIAFRKAICEANNNLHSLTVHQPNSSLVDYLLVDAFNIPRVKGIKFNHQNPIIKGDSLSISIAAASIIAKVYRDSLMTELSKKPKYAKYNWHKNKGYGTASHRVAILKHGITKLHRQQFIETFLTKSEAGNVK